jgi:hypothetical protein
VFNERGDFFPEERFLGEERFFGEFLKHLPFAVIW